MSDNHDPSTSGATPADPSSNPAPQADPTPQADAQGATPGQYGQPGEQHAHGQPQYDASQQYGQQPAYEQPAYEQPQYDAPQYDATQQYAQPAYEQPQYDAPQYDATQQYGQPVDQTAIAGFAPLSPAPSGGSTTSTARSLLTLAAIVLPIAGVAAAFCLARWVESSWAAFGAVGAIVVALGAVAALAPKHNALPAVLAAVVVTPFALYSSYSYGLHERFDDEWGTTTTSSPTPGGEDEDDPAPVPSRPTQGGDDEDEPSEPSEPSESSADTVAFAQTGKVLGFEVKVESAKCGLPQLENAAYNPDSWEDGQPEFLSYKAPAGKQLCVVVSTWKNASQEPVNGFSRPEFKKVTSAEGTSYEQTDDDREASRYHTEFLGYDDDTVNPGDVIKVAAVFSVPTGTDVTVVNTSGYDFDSDDMAEYDVDFATK